MKINENHFLSNEQELMKSFAYFGKFFASIDFDDGWKHQIQSQLLEYISQLDNKEFLVEHVIDTSRNIVFVTLGSKELNQERESQIENITTQLQRNFHCKSLFQYLGFGQKENSILPLELDEISQSSFGHERQKFQSGMKEILLLENEIENLKDKKKKIDSYDDIMAETFHNELEKAHEELQQSEEQLEKIVKNLYLSLSIKKSSQTPNIIPEFQADSLIREGNQQKDHDLFGTVLGHLEESELYKKIFDELLKKAQSTLNCTPFSGVEIKNL